MFPLATFLTFLRELTHKDYRLKDCSAGINRLVHEGVPQTYESAAGAAGAGGGAGAADGENIAEATQVLITAMDAVKLDYKSMDELSPQISDCVRVLDKIRSLPADMAGKAKLIEWRRLMHGMGAADELSEEQCRQLAFDLERTYEEFHRSLAKK